MCGYFARVCKWTRLFCPKCNLNCVRPRAHGLFVSRLFQVLRAWGECTFVHLSVVSSVLHVSCPLHNLCVFSLLTCDFCVRVRFVPLLLSLFSVIAHHLGGCVRPPFFVLFIAFADVDHGPRPHSNGARVVRCVISIILVFHLLCLILVVATRANPGRPRLPSMSASLFFISISVGSCLTSFHSLSFLILSR